jgi:predicted ATPase
MIKSLRIQNFKSWADTGEMRLAPITGLFGTNSSGKTSILQLLLLLKQTVESADRTQVLNLGDEHTTVDLGTFRDIVFQHASPGWIEWRVIWSHSGPLQRSNVSVLSLLDSLLAKHDVEFVARVKQITAKSPRPIVDHFRYGFVESQPEGQALFYGMERCRDSEDRYMLTTAGKDLARLSWAPTIFPPPVKCYGFPFQVSSALEEPWVLSNLQLAFELAFQGIQYLGPLRDDPRRQYVWSGTQPSDVGRRGERAIHAMLASRDRDEKVSRGSDHPPVLLEVVVAEWLKRLGLVHEFSVKPVARGSSLYQVYVRLTRRSPRVLLTEVGFGVSQVLPVLVLCYYARPGSTIILEQPEIHLHPAVQAGLADVLIDAVKTHNVQIILESHSEHLLTRLQRRIAEGVLGAEDTALYFCDLRDGISRLTPLDIDTYGNISNWPQDFFGDELGELAAMTTAAADRQMAEAAR